jgi:2-methylaconitate cis-trans-isomerase PrpF
MSALSTLSSRLRKRIPHLSCAIIKSGTSRFVILREEELPTGGARGKIILDLLANDISTEGVGGQHYQSNKVAVMGLVAARPPLFSISGGS